MYLLKNKKFIFISIFLLFFANMSFSYAYWASEVLENSDNKSAQIGIGTWLPTGFIGVTQDGLDGTITLDQIGTTGYPLDGSYILMSNINWNNNTFTPIGGASEIFSGVFLGNGFTISNMSITTDQPHVGLFARNSGTISGVSLINVNANVSSAEDLFAGGLVGENLSTGVIVKSYTTGTLTISVTKSANTDGLTSNAFGGGLVGINNGSVAVSHSSVNVSVTTNTAITSGGNRNGFANSYAGGLIGRNTSTNGVNDTYAEGNVVANSIATANGNSRGHATSVAGGLVGQTTTSTGINSSFAAGNVTSTTSGKTTNTVNIGPVSAIGLVNTSYRRNGQLINNTTNGGTANGATLATLTELRSESFLTNNLGWVASEWIFDTSHYPRIFGNTY